MATDEAKKWDLFESDGRSAFVQGPCHSLESLESSDSSTGEAQPMSDALNPCCFVCGEENPLGLHLCFKADDKHVFSNWTPRAGWESFQGIIHGGILSAVLDEAMAKAIISKGKEAFTADLRIRFRKKVCVGDEVLVKGWVVSVDRRRILAEASLICDDGEERAHAWGVFLVARTAS